MLLLVEDDPEVSDAVVETLVDAGYAVTSAPNGLEALKQLRAAIELPRLILLDLMMPVMDGWMFRAEQQSDARLSSIPVVVLSAHRDLRSVDAADYLRKPIDLEKLLEIVARFCGAAD